MISLRPSLIREHHSVSSVKFPFTVQVYLNGHSWLEKQMLKRRLGFNSTAPPM